MGKRPLTTAEFITRSKGKYDDKFLYDNTIYKNQNTKVSITCRIHGEFESYPVNHLRVLGGCRDCQKIQNGVSHKKDTSFFIKKAIEVHGDVYDYSITNYEHSLKKVDIICKLHGIFTIKPSNHTNNKQGCHKCGLERTIAGSRKSVSEFLEEIKTKENYKHYDFSKIISIQSRRYSKIECVCEKHGEYTTTPKNALRNIFFGCKTCSIEDDRYDTHKFVEISEKIHSNYYSYEKTHYSKSHEPVIITCPKHGDFECMAYMHMAGGGVCQKCTNFVSSYEISINQFLQSENVELDSSYRKFPGVSEIDLISHQHKIGIEFNGLYWHSDLFKVNDYHKMKTSRMRDNGYRLFHIFEDEWLLKEAIWKSILLNSFGKSKRTIHARKCTIKEVSYKDSKVFLSTNHLQGNCVSKIRLGLFMENELVSLMTFGNLRRCVGSTAKSGSYELLRFCSLLNTTVIGGASKLFKHFLGISNAENIISYCDIRTGTGKIYEILGFSFVGETNPNYFYVRGQKRYNRFGFRKDVLIKDGFDPDKTESAIMKERGYSRIYDCGSMRFEYTKFNSELPLG